MSPTAAKPSTITRENYNRIQVGMTLSEVETIMGPPSSTMNEDVKPADGGKQKKINQASWVQSKSKAQAGGKPQALEERWISVDLKDGKVTGKREKGLP